MWGNTTATVENRLFVDTQFLPYYAENAFTTTNIVTEHASGTPLCFSVALWTSHLFCVVAHQPREPPHTLWFSYILKGPCQSIG